MVASSVTVAFGIRTGLVLAVTAIAVAAVTVWGSYLRSRPTGEEPEEEREAG
ncbi:hypothetical protein NKH77_40400 [Streptomyces sp. M19]